MSDPTDRRMMKSVWPSKPGEATVDLADPNGIEKLTESTGAGPTYHGEFLGAEPMSDPTDIVERLRRTAQSLGSAVVILTAAEGEQIAAEIVKLREALAPFTLCKWRGTKANPDPCGGCTGCSLAEVLNPSIDELREASDE